MVASYHGNTEAVKLLVNRGANVNATNLNGTTVIMYAKSGATKLNDVAILAWLLEKGGDMSTRDISGKDLLAYSKLENNVLVTNFITGYKSLFKY